LQLRIAGRGAVNSDAANGLMAWTIVPATAIMAGKGTEGPMSERKVSGLDPVRVGNNIRRVRRAEGKTLKELSKASGVSIATISKIETSKTAGGFDTIYKIARGLGVLVTEIIASDEENEQRLVTARDSPEEMHKTRHYDYFPKAHRPHGWLNPYVMSINTRTVPELRAWSIHDGEEVIIVLSGEIELHLEGENPQRLSEGDSACFNCGIRHAFVRVSDGPARIVSVSTRAHATRVDDRLAMSAVPSSAR
jgi:transcriptional regulator with XRE-family HTH domain